MLRGAQGRWLWVIRGGVELSLPNLWVSKGALGWSCPDTASVCNRELLEEVGLTGIELHLPKCCPVCVSLLSVLCLMLD